MAKTKNVLFIMCDQLRWDYLSCYGHPHIETPNIDRLAAMGVRFDRAYVQSPICGPARASMYTGRYVSSTGASLNLIPLQIGEQFLGDYLAELGVRTVLSGKTHMVPDREGMARVGIDPESPAGQRLAQGAFEPYWRDDGLHPNDERSKNTTYNQYLRSLGYEGDNPWHTHANSVLDEDGNFLSGWFNQAAKYPANIKEEHSETAYTTNRAMEFIEEAGKTPWCLHVSYIKPHWPYIAPDPYHNMYGVEDVIPVNRSDTERENTHPVLAAMMNHLPSQHFSRDSQMRDAVIPPYMGLIKQIDDHVGRLLDFLEARGQLDQTMIVFTSDHGDYLGDHWLSEKDFFHEAVVRIPLIIVDPSPEADATRGTVETRLVESLDFIPTFVEALGGKPHFRLEGQSLLPLLHGQEVAWREYVICEVDYSDREANYHLDLPPAQCWAVMVRTEEWKYIAFNGFRPMLFDLINDPEELNDLGDDPAYETVCNQMRGHLEHWAMRRKIRAVRTEESLEAAKWNYGAEKNGLFIGYWSPDDLPDVVKRHRGISGEKPQ